MKLLKNKELVKEKWLLLLDKSEFSNPFQSPQYYDLFNSVDGYSADVFAIEKEGIYVSLMVVSIHKEKGIKGFFSIRGIVFGGPLILGNQAEYLEHLLTNVKVFYKSKLIYLEIRNHFDYSTFFNTFLKSNYTYSEHLNVQLNIENLNVESALLGMNSTKRRQIRMSYKEGAVAREAESEMEVAQLFEILKTMYEERVKLPILPYELFLNLYKSDIGKVFVALHDNKIIGGAFCIYYPNTSINTFYYTDIRNYHKKIYPSHIALKEAIDFGINNKLKMVDFMGAGKPNTEYGVRDYKLRFGGTLVEDGRFTVIFKPFLYNLGIWGLKILSKLK